VHDISCMRGAVIMNSPLSHERMLFLLWFFLSVFMYNHNIILLDSHKIHDANSCTRLIVCVGVLLQHGTIKKL
jgi:hypothetical protein